MQLAEISTEELEAEVLRLQELEPDAAMAALDGNAGAGRAGRGLTPRHGASWCCRQYGTRCWRANARRSRRRAARARAHRRVFEAYQPLKARVQGSKPHPGKLVESAAMAAVEPPDVTTRRTCRRPPITEGKASDAQLEAVIYAGPGARQFLPAENDPETTACHVPRAVLHRRRHGRGQGPRNRRHHPRQPAPGPHQARVAAKRPAWSTTPSATSRASAATMGMLFPLGATTARQGKARWRHHVHHLRHAAPGRAERTPKKEREVRPLEGLQARRPVVEWLGADFDGVIAFDEAHNLRNRRRGRGRQRHGARRRRAAEPAAERARGVRLRHRRDRSIQPHVRARLGLWGANTPFVDANEAFAAEIARRGARGDGARRARHEGAGQLHRALALLRRRRRTSSWTPAHAAADRNLRRARQGVADRPAEHQPGAQGHQPGKNGKAKSAALSRFWSRTSASSIRSSRRLQTPTIIERAQAELADGNAVVFQLVNTNEATQERAARAREAEGTALEELDFTPRDADRVRAQRRTRCRSTRWSAIRRPAPSRARRCRSWTRRAARCHGQGAGRQARCADPEARSEIRVPDNPIDLIIEAIGDKNTAEVTGRGRRFVRKLTKDGEFEVEEQKRGSKLGGVPTPTPSWTTRRKRR
jgi:hypothetical protein